VHQVSGWLSGAAEYFWLGARSEEGEYPLRSSTDERQSSRPKGAQSSWADCDENGPAAALLLSHGKTLLNPSTDHREPRTV
jgi:hypothetical protein